MRWNVRSRDLEERVVVRDIEFLADGFKRLYAPLFENPERLLVNQLQAFEQDVRVRSPAALNVK